MYNGIIRVVKKGYRAITCHKAYNNNNFMPVSGSKVVAPNGKEFEVLPQDIYQVELLDVEQKTQKKWKSDEEEDVFVFTFVILDDGEFYGRRMWEYAAQKLSKYKGGSKLYKALVGLNGGVQLTDEACMTPEETCSDNAINALIGKQVRLTVGQKAKQDGSLKNVIESYLPVKKDLPAFNPDNIQKADETAVDGVKDMADEISFDK